MSFDQTLPAKGIQILGVYKVPIEATSWASSGRPAGSHSEGFDKLWLLEFLIERSDREFDQSEYTQADVSLREELWQIAYGEVFLNESGTHRQHPEIGKPLRVAFFFHDLKLDQPLITPNGKVRIPTVTPFPDRLKELITYDPPC